MVVCFLFSLFRITTAVGAALSQTAMVAILCALFPNHVLLVFGMLEFVVGIGNMISPCLSGLMYEVGGCKLPFIFLEF